MLPPPPARWLARLPAPLQRALAALAGPLLRHLLRYRRQVLRDNQRHAFPGLDAAARRRLERDSYRHLGTLALEVLRAGSMPQAAFRRHVHFVNPQLLRQVTGGFRQQALLLLIHQGNWEWVLQAAVAQLPVPVDPLYKPLHERRWNDFMLRSRARFGARPVALREAAGELLRRRRERRLIAMLADQSGPRGGYWTDFLGRPASFHRGPARLARALGLPLLFARCRRRRRGHYEVEFRVLSLPPHGDSEEALLERYVRAAEEAIAAQPETYLWTNRRWRRRPPGSEGGH